MKHTKKGFSLAELLIAIAIISVLATIGFSMTKRTIDRAYDYYIYTGYKGISDAIADANVNNQALTTPSINNTEFEKHIINLFDAKKDEEDGYIKTPNGIWYKMEYWKSGVNNTVHYYYIEMQTPTKKKLVNNTVVTRETTCFAYAPEEGYNILIPFNGTNGGNLLSSCKSTIPNLHQRIDLLPFYVDDGIAGRTLLEEVNGQEVRTYYPKTYKSADQALCEAYGKVSFAGYTFTESCSTIVDPPKGSVRLENPRKVF